MTTSFTDANVFVNKVTGFVRRAANDTASGGPAVIVVVTKSDGATNSFSLKLSPASTSPTPRPPRRATLATSSEKRTNPMSTALFGGPLSFVTRCRLARDFFYDLVDRNPRPDSITNDLSDDERAWLHVLRNYDVNVIVKMLGRDWTFDNVVDFGREIHLRGFAAYNAASSAAEARQAAITWHKQFLQAWLSLDEVAEANHCARVRAECATQ